MLINPVIDLDQGVVVAVQGAIDPIGIGHDPIAIDRGLTGIDHDLTVVDVQDPNVNDPGAHVQMNQESLDLVLTDRFHVIAMVIVAGLTVEMELTELLPL